MLTLWLPSWPNVLRFQCPAVHPAAPAGSKCSSAPLLRAGETRDTAELGLIGAYLSDNFVPRNQRVRLFRTWGSGIGMLPAGGTAAWGNATWAPDDTEDMIARNLTYGCGACAACVEACVCVCPAAGPGRLTLGYRCSE